MKKIFGERLLLRETEKEDALQKGIYVPESSKRGYAFCEVVQIGNGTLGSSQKSPPPDLAQGDVVFVQVNPQMAAASGHVIDGKRYYTAHWHDALAVVTSRPITLETFRPIGRWVLVAVQIDESVGPIIVPNQTVQNSSGKVTFTISKLGVTATAQLGLEAGNEVILDKARANVFNIGKDRFVYIDADYVTGLVS